MLRKKGYTIRKTIDVVIATFCIEHQFSLLHNDNDFCAVREISLAPNSEEELNEIYGKK